MPCASRTCFPMIQPGNSTPSFEFATASRILFGAGTVCQVASAARQMGSRALLVTGSNPERLDPVRADLESSGVACAPFAVKGEPTVETVRQGVKLAAEQGCEFVIGFGGGSAIDAAKAIAALLTQEGDLLDYIEVVGKGLPIKQPSARCIAIPTTAGTGAEVTRNAVLALPEYRLKASLRSPYLLPTLAVVDPELTLSLPPALTACTGMDALTQLMEAFVGRRANPITDGLCLEGMKRAATALPLAFHNGADSEARTGMALASVLGGLALANAGLGAVHGLAAPLGGMFPAPHGAVCAALLPCVIEANLSALRRGQAESPTLRRYETVARILTGRTDATADEAATRTKQLCAELGIPPLRTWGVRAEDLESVALKGTQASSMKGNPVELSTRELIDLLAKAL